MLGLPHTLYVGVDQPRQKPGTPTIVFVHGLARTHRVWNYALTQLPKSSRIITVDLLGFGSSPKPEWHSYNARAQATCLRTTLRRKGVRGSIVIVGHSLGALVAIEYAKKYPGKVQKLVLCSTPLYKSEPRYIFSKFKLPNSENFYKTILKNAREKPELTRKINYYARRVKFIDHDFVVDERNIVSVARSIEMAIENQSAFAWLMKTDIPTTLIYGRLDPYVIKKYYTALAKHNVLCQVHPIIASHEVNRNKQYAEAIKTTLFTEA